MYIGVVLQKVRDPNKGNTNVESVVWTGTVANSAHGAAHLPEVQRMNYARGNPGFVYRTVVFKAVLQVNPPEEYIDLVDFVE